MSRCWLQESKGSKGGRTMTGCMRMHLQTEEKKKTVIENHGEEKWQSMIDQLPDPDKILWTYNHILPNFLHISMEQLVAQ